MGISAWLVWRRKAQPGRVAALVVFGLQLVLNVLWSAIFFGLRMPGAAAMEVVVLELAVIVTIFLFVRVSWIAALLLVPYAAWVAFAAYLNMLIWQLNS